MAFKSDKQRKGFYGNKGSQITTRKSGEGRAMNKSMQVYNLKRELKLEGFDPDTFDVESEIDASLRYNENKDRILNKVERNRERYSKHQIDDETLSFEKDQALDFHNQRSEISQRMDENKPAQTIITDKVIINNPMRLNKWYENPNRLDIQGVDDY